MNEIFSLIVGALLATGGGYIGYEARTWRERNREKESIYICISDELRGIEATINNMHQVWESANMFNPNHLTDLLASTTAYDSLRGRLFLISDAILRKDIGDFYKKLKDTVKKIDGKLGTLAETPEATAEQKGFDTEFQNIAS